MKVFSCSVFEQPCHSYLISISNCDIGALKLGKIAPVPSLKLSVKEENSSNFNLLLYCVGCFLSCYLAGYKLPLSNYIYCSVVVDTRSGLIDSLILPEMLIYKVGISSWFSTCPKSSTFYFFQGTFLNSGQHLEIIEVD